MPHSNVYFFTFCFEQYAFRLIFSTSFCFAVFCYTMLPIFEAVTFLIILFFIIFMCHFANTLQFFTVRGTLERPRNAICKAAHNKSRVGSQNNQSTVWLLLCFCQCSQAHSITLISQMKRVRRKLLRKSPFVPDSKRKEHVICMVKGLDVRKSG